MLAEKQRVMKAQAEAEEKAEKAKRVQEEARAKAIMEVGYRAARIVSDDQVWTEQAGKANLFQFLQQFQSRVQQNWYRMASSRSSMLCCAGHGWPPMITNKLMPSGNRAPVLWMCQARHHQAK